MSDEEKAFELSSINKYGFSVEESNAAYNSALEMAEWKQQQIIDKAVEWLALNAQLYGGFNHGCLEDMVTKFKQAMIEE